jgi:preprotein translocase subunit SecG
MEQILLVIHVIIAAALIGMVLIQRSDSDGFGLGSGSGSNLLSGRSAANLMTRTTAILAALFIANSLILSILASQHHNSSLIDTLEKEQATTEAPAVAGDTKKIDAKEIAKKETPPAVPNAGEVVKKEAAEKPKVKEKKPVSETSDDSNE